MDSGSKRPVASEKGTYLGPSVRFEGVLTGRESLTIAGRLKGRIEIPEHLVEVAQGADVEADIKAGQVCIRGSVRGNIQGLQRVELSSTANLEGRLVTREIRVEDGAVFRGQVDILTKSQDFKD